MQHGHTYPVDSINLDIVLEEVVYSWKPFWLLSLPPTWFLEQTISRGGIGQYARKIESLWGLERDIINEFRVNPASVQVSGTSWSLDFYRQQLELGIRS